MILVLGASAHYWALFWDTKFCNRAVEHIDLVEEIDNIHCEPLVQVLALWKYNLDREIEED